MFTWAKVSKKSYRATKFTAWTSPNSSFSLQHPAHSLWSLEEETGGDQSTCGQDQRGQDNILLHLVQLCKCILTGTSTAKVSFLETSLEIVAHWESYSTELRLILWNLFFFELIVCGAFFYMCCATFEVKLGRIVPVWANCTSLGKLYIMWSILWRLYVYVVISLYCSFTSSRGFQRSWRPSNDAYQVFEVHQRFRTQWVRQADRGRAPWDQKWDPGPLSAFLEICQTLLYLVRNVPRVNHYRNFPPFLNLSDFIFSQNVNTSTVYFHLSKNLSNLTLP